MSTKKIKQALDAAILICFFSILLLFFVWGELGAAALALVTGAALVLVDYIFIDSQKR